MYEAINLGRQIASSLVRSQANCWDAVEYRVASFPTSPDVRFAFRRPSRPAIDERTID